MEDVNFNSISRKVASFPSSLNKSLYESKETNIIVGKNLAHDKKYSFKLLQCIGFGAFSKIYKASFSFSISTHTVAIKKVKHGYNSNLLQEFNIIKSLSHPNIIKVLDFYNCIHDDDSNNNSDQSSFLTMEFLSGNNLYDWLAKREPCSEVEAARLFLQIVNTLKYLHLEKKICHHDLKLENFVFSDSSELKLVDFELACPLSDVTFDCGTFHYSAPEIFDKNTIKKLDGSKVDIFSAGVILYCLLFGEYPFQALDEVELLEKIRIGKVKFPHEFDISFSARDLLSNLLNPDPLLRFDLNQIISHDWLNIEKGSLSAWASNYIAPKVDFHTNYSSINNNDFNKRNFIEGDDSIDIDEMINWRSSSMSSPNDVLQTNTDYRFSPRVRNPYKFSSSINTLPRTSSHASKIDSSTANIPKHIHPQFSLIESEKSESKLDSNVSNQNEFSNWRKSLSKLPYDDIDEMPCDDSEEHWLINKTK